MNKIPLLFSFISCFLTVVSSGTAGIEDDRKDLNGIWEFCISEDFNDSIPITVPGNWDTHEK